MTKVAPEYLNFSDLTWNVGTEFKNLFDNWCYF